MSIKQLRLCATVMAVFLIPGELKAQVRIVQTNAAGDNVHVIDPATNKVVDVIEGIHIPHGVTSQPDGSRLYVSNEHDRTLDVISTTTMKVVKKIPLSAGPHNIDITPDGAKVYVAIMNDGAALDVVDTRRAEVVKTIPMAGGVHNVYVTPDGRHAVAGMIGARTLTVVDTRTDEALWSYEFKPELGLNSLEDAGVRPMAFEQNPDGSTKHIFVQTSGFHGVRVIDFKTQKLTRSIKIPDLPLTEIDNDALQGSPGHGLEVTADGRTLWFASKPHNRVYAFSLPNLELVGSVKVGYHPDWLTSTPDSRYVYAANAGSNSVSAVDRETMTEVARIPVGQTPKRNHTLILPR